MPKPGLMELYLSHRGKVSDKWEAYFGIYDRVFAGLRDAPVRLLEIGVQNGGSLELWARYFESARLILGCDVDQRCAALQYDDDRIDVVAADVNSSFAYDDIRSLSERFDIIIDDGSHRSRDIIKALLRYFPLLEPGGLFVIEDLHAVYGGSHEGGPPGAYSAMDFLKLLADLVNADFWRNDLPVANLLERYLSGAEPPAFLSDGSIESIEFSNSMAVIRRRAGPAMQGCGRRVIVGQEAMIAPAVLALRDQGSGS
ncbi:MAG TPA: class I SAM-dependent methyltransferase [Burkholderiales bacterium]|nr:class I SAM-dependent methyltransferase [Burkholderiales bacterium]